MKGGMTRRVPIRSLVGSSVSPSIRRAVPSRGRKLRGRGRAERRERQALASALDAIAVEVAGGTPLRHALVAIGSLPDAPRPLGTLADLVRSGDDGRRLASGAPEVEGRDERVVAVVLAALVESGAEGAGELDRLAASLRERSELDAEIRSAASPAFASAATLSILPVFGVVALGAVEPATLRWLTSTRPGIVLSLAAAGWNALGWVWMRRAVAAVVS